MTELEIFRQVAEGLGLGATIIIASAWLFTRGISAWRENSKERNAIEELRIQNERLERESTHKRDAELSLLIRDLSAKNEAVAKILENVSDKLVDDNTRAIEATKTAENHVTAKLDTQHSILTAHTDGITTITTKLDEFIALFVEYTKKHSQELETTINAKAREMLSLLQVQMNELQNQLVKERLKAYEEISERFRDIPTVNVSAINADAPERASGGNGHSADGD